MKSQLIKVRIDVVEDPKHCVEGCTKRWMVNKWVFEKKSGRTLEHFTVGTGYTYREAHSMKKQILKAYC